MLRRDVSPEGTRMSRLVNLTLSWPSSRVVSGDVLTASLLQVDQPGAKNNTDPPPADLWSNAIGRGHWETLAGYALSTTTNTEDWRMIRRIRVRSPHLQCRLECWLRSQAQSIVATQALLSSGHDTLFSWFCASSPPADIRSAQQRRPTQPRRLFHSQLVLVLKLITAYRRRT